MELKLENGRYVPGPGGLCRVSGPEETAQRVMMKLAAPRGAFPPLPEYGSALRELLRAARPSEDSAVARQAVADALSDEPEVAVTAVEAIREGETLRVDVHFTAAGQAFQTAVRL